MILIVCYSIRRNSVKNKVKNILLNETKTCNAALHLLCM